MRDLKHLIYFEDLLQEANNDLVKQAKDDGKLALGYTCYFMPEVLLDLPGCFSVRLRAPRCTSPDMATYYMSSRTCHYGRSLLERALEGGFNFLDAQLATETCTVTCRFQEHLQRMPGVINNPRFKCEFTDVPFKKTTNSIDHYEAQLKAHVVDFLRDNYGVDTSDEALLKTIESHNELCRIMQAIGDFRKLDVPTITGYEYHVLTLATLACPKYLIIDKLRETLEELKTRQPDAKPQYRCKVLLAGSENDDPDFTKLIESCGALVVADRYTTSNAVHQASKLPEDERKAYLDWLFELEYGKLGLPKPDLVIYLDMPTEITEQMMRRRERDTGTHADIHEQDEAYLKSCRASAKGIAAACGWVTISCAQDGGPRTPEDIHSQVWELAGKLL